MGDREAEAGARTTRSLAMQLASAPPELAAALTRGMSERALAELAYRWAFWQRADQVPPPGIWRTWLVMAGRGFGKTRTGAEWVRGIAEADPSARIAIIGATAADARRVMVEGESGVLAVAHPARRPEWRPSTQELRWPNGALATIYSAAEPESLRGPQHSHAWADEIAKWAKGVTAWDNLMLALRSGATPQVVATTTPRPVPLMRRLLAEPGVVVTRGATAANRAHLSPRFIAAVTEIYGRGRLARQELEGEWIDDPAGALWRRDLIEAGRRPAPDAARRVVIGVDPPAGTAGDACGIVAVALDGDGHGHVIEDASIAGASPERWAAAVAACARRHDADRVVAEANQGGAMVASVLTAADHALPVKLVHASRGKSARAEPVAVLYEQGRVHHASAFPELEDELCGLIAGGGYEGPGRSPDRADALIWALTELMLGARAQASVRVM